MVDYSEAKTVYVRRLLDDEAFTAEHLYSKSQMERIAAALSRAKSTRDFEINLYWTRSAYFWGFQAVFFGSFGLLAQGYVGAKGDDIFQQILMLAFMSLNAIVATIVSYLWLLMLKGAKFWQNNWERHIDILEDFVDGPLYKTYFVPSTELRRDASFRPPSVTKINEMIACVVTFLWMAIFYVCSFVVWSFEPTWLPKNTVLAEFAFLLVSIIFAAGLIQFFNRKLRMNHLGTLTSELERSSHQILFRNSLELRKGGQAQ